MISVARYFALGLALVTIARATAGPTASFADIIRQEGTITLSDGSSLFHFSKDGAFSQEPLGMSGRAVNGKWATDFGGELFTITGNWSWVNGYSHRSDPRKMVMAVYPEPGEFETIDRLGTPVRVYKCYFEIESVVKDRNQGDFGPANQ